MSINSDDPTPNPTSATGQLTKPESKIRSTRAIRRLRRKARRASRSAVRRWLIRGGFGLGLLILVLLAGTVGYSLFRLAQINRIKSFKVVAQSGPAENILLIGSTDRCSATKIKQFKLKCENGVNGINSDVVLVMHLVPKTGKASLLSIPRDTFVPDARSGGLYNKIDAALLDSPDQLAAAIEQDFDIPINHFVELNFESFEGVVNALGGLHLYFPNRLVDGSSGLNVHHTGCLPFNGSESLELVRSRHLYWFKTHQRPNLPAIQAATNDGTYYTSRSGGQYDGSGDLGRIARVHLFLKALASVVKARGLGNPLTDNSLISAVAPNLTVDSTFGDSALVRLVLDFRNVDIASTPELTAPIVIDPTTYFYKGFNYGDVVFPTEPQDQQAIDEFLGTKPAGLKLAPSSISISVVNGTNSRVTATRVGSELKALGYRIVPTTASNYVGAVSETTVEYAPGHIQQAERVLSSLAGTVVLGQGTPAGGADVSVVAGSDLTVAPTGVVGTTSSTYTGTTARLTAYGLGATLTASSSPVPPKSDLGAPTSANPTAAPYDPRSCPTRSTK